MATRALLVAAPGEDRDAVERVLVVSRFEPDIVDEMATAVARLDGRVGDPDRDPSVVVVLVDRGRLEDMQPLLDAFGDERGEDLPTVFLARSISATLRGWIAGRSDTALLSSTALDRLPRLLSQWFEFDEADDTPVDDAAARRRVLLLVCDDAGLQASLRGLLLRAGYDVVIADRLDAAIESVRAAPRSLVLLDANIADGTGDVWCRRMRTVSARAVIVLFADAPGDGTVARALRAGAVTCLSLRESDALLALRLAGISRLLADTVEPSPSAGANPDDGASVRARGSESVVTPDRESARPSEPSDAMSESGPDAINTATRRLLTAVDAALGRTAPDRPARDHLLVLAAQWVTATAEPEQTDRAFVMQWLPVIAAAAGRGAAVVALSPDRLAVLLSGIDEPTSYRRLRAMAEATRALGVKGRDVHTSAAIVPLGAMANRTAARVVRRVAVAQRVVAEGGWNRALLLGPDRLLRLDASSR